MRNGPPYSRPRVWPNFKADLRCYSPESHSLEEKKTICNERLSTSKAALEKHQAIIQALKDEVDASKERMEYLQSLNVLLERAVKDLRQDLGIDNA